MLYNVVMDIELLRLILSLVMVVCFATAFVIFVALYRHQRRHLAYLQAAARTRAQRHPRAPRTRSYARTGR